MAKALKCDRCGIFYSDNKKEIKGNVIVGIGLLARGTGIGTSNYVGMKKIDLCDNCVCKLEEFLGNEEKDNFEEAVGLKFVDADETGYEYRCTKCGKSFYLSDLTTAGKRRIPSVCICGNVLIKFKK